MPPLWAPYSWSPRLTGSRVHFVALRGGFTALPHHPPGRFASCWYSVASAGPAGPALSLGATGIDGSLNPQEGEVP